jgi:triosephosphate isomerase
VIERQVEGGLKGLGDREMRNIVIAYEPVWAIGTGKTATPEQAEEVHRFIREKLEKLYSRKISEEIRIQYGGSVTPENIKGLMTQANIDGALVGGASLKAESFSKIVRFKEI